MPSPRKKAAAIGIKTAYPSFIEPALATSIDKVPSGERWVHEIKFDGYRVQVHLRDAAVKVFTRRGRDWTNRFRKIAADAWHINAGSAIIDGEVVVPAEDGTTDFSVLQNELKGQSKKDRDGHLRSAFPQWPRSAESAAVRAQGLTPQDHRRDRYPIQRELRGRQSGDVQARLQDWP
jgi:ATP-dependent DNA ligase